MYFQIYLIKNDMAVFTVAAENSKDEIAQFQMGRYVSSNEAMWRNFFISYTCCSLGQTLGKW